MNIAMDCNIFTLQKYGGVSRYFVRLGDELTNMGNHVTIHGLLHVNRYLADSSQQITRMRNINYFPKYTRRISHIAGDLLAEMEFLHHAPDLIHETYYQSRIVGSSKLPRICTVHDLIHDIYPDIWGHKDRTSELRDKTIKRCDAIICVSENTRQDLIRITGVNPDKTHVVHHGFELNSNKTELNDLENTQLQRAISKPYLLYVGKRHSYKNFKGFLEGFSDSDALGDIRIIAFGGGSFQEEEQLFATKLGIPFSHITQLDGSDALLFALYKNATAFVFPSLYEGFGLPPLEAISAGCPVLASNSSCIPEIAGDAAIYFDPKDHSSISNAIDSVLKSETARSKIIEAGYERIKDFSWNKCASQTLQVYQKVTGL